MGYRSTLWNGYHLQRQADHRTYPFRPFCFSLPFLSRFLCLSVLFLFLSDPLSVSRFSPRAKLLMNIGPKYQSTGDPARVRRCSSVHMSVYYRGLHTPIPLVVTSYEGSPFLASYVYMVTLVCPALILRLSRTTLSLV